jgi:hypothetical protein
MHNREFGQSYCNDLPKWIRKKFILYFLIFILFSIQFRSLYIFSGNSKLKTKSQFGKIGRIVTGHYLAHDHGPMDQSVNGAQRALAAVAAQLAHASRRGQRARSVVTATTLGAVARWWAAARQLRWLMVVGMSTRAPWRSCWATGA